MAVRVKSEKFQVKALQHLGFTDATTFMDHRHRPHTFVLGQRCKTYLHGSLR